MIDMETWQWMFGFFIIIMLARLVPRFIRSRQAHNIETNYVTNPEQQYSSDDAIRPEPAFTARPQQESTDMIVLGAINRGVNSFGKIKQKTGMDSEELDKILEGLENRGLMRSEKKQGLLGIKIELYVTDKGFKEYYS